jgi:2-oxoglutarate dehydrogenase complex dehydrogenase (E1) component-like enzyme
VRIEQIAPFPHQHLRKALEKYGANATIDWVQEEHENYGAWTYMQPRLTKLLNKKVRFFGRKPSAATAVGALKLHKIEEVELMKSIFQTN